MTIREKTAWLHKTAIELKTDDLVELKFSLKKLLAEGEDLLELVRAEIRKNRRQANG